MSIIAYHRSSRNPWTAANLTSECQVTFNRIIEVGGGGGEERRAYALEKPTSMYILHAHARALSRKPSCPFHCQHFLWGPGFSLSLPGASATQRNVTGGRCMYATVFFIIIIGFLVLFLGEGGHAHPELHRARVRVRGLISPIYDPA